MASTEVETVEMPAVDDLLPSIATVQVTPEQAKAQNEQINAVITEVLKEGQNGDYWRIPGTPTPTLLQPGAETLQRFFGLGRKLADPETGVVEIDGKAYFSCQVKCSVTNSQDRVISESFGYCDDTEAKRNGGPGSKWRGNRHTIIQIATKRAYVSAIKTATGTSNHFTVDLEDVQEPQAQPLVNDRMASDMEIECLLALFIRKGGKTASEAAEWLTSYGSKAESRNWVAIQVLALSQKPDKDPTVPGSQDAPSGVVHTEPELPVGEAVPGSGSGDTHPSGEGAAESPDIIEGEITDAIEVPW